MRALIPLLLVACTEYDLKRDPGPAGGGGETGGPAGGEGEGEGEPPDSAEDGGDTLDIGEPVDVVLLVDIAYWYDCYHPDLAVNAPALVRALFDTGEDIGVAIATYDDYYSTEDWWVAYGGRPYDLVQQLSTDLSTVAAAAATLEMQWGGDGPGTGHEALLQATEGLGYDQDCDGSYDSDADIRPFRADAGDAFAGGVSGYYDPGVDGSGAGYGVGLRANSRRVVVLFAENQLRDRALDHEFPSGPCPKAAGRSDAIEALQTRSAQFLGVNSYEYQDEDPSLQEQLVALAEGRGSRIDTDGDGAADDPAVLSGSWDWPPTELLVSAILTLASE